MSLLTTFPHGQCMQKNMLNYSALYDHQEQITFDLITFIFIFIHYQDSFTKTHNHLCSCA